MTLPNLSLTDWLAIGAGAFLVIYNFGGTALTWVEALWNKLFNKTPVNNPATELQVKFNLWLQMRALPDLTPDAIKYLELLKNELLKWD